MDGTAMPVFALQRLNFHVGEVHEGEKCYFISQKNALESVTTKMTTA